MLTTATFTTSEMAIVQGVLAMSAPPNDVSRAWLLLQESEHQRFIAQSATTPQLREHAALKARTMAADAERALNAWRAANDDDLRGEYLDHLAMEYENINKEGYTMTTTPITNAQPAAKPAARPPIPATVPESKSAALIVVEKMREEIDSKLDRQSFAIDGARVDAMSIKTAITEINSEIAVMRGMVESIAELVQAIAAQIAQTPPPSDLNKHFGTSKITEQEARPHYCTEHQCDFVKHEKDGRTWYSHRAPDDSWCREKVKK